MSLSPNLNEKLQASFGFPAFRAGQEQCVQQLLATGRDTAETKVKTERRPAMEDMLCAMAPKSTNGRQTPHHTKAGLPVCCEQALKSVGKQNTHGGCRCGGLREPARAREVALRGGMKRLCLIYRRRRFGGGGHPLLANYRPEISACFASGRH